MSVQVAIMIFVGFGFLMTFLKRYSYSAVGLNFFCSCVVILEALLVVGAVQQVLSSSHCCSSSALAAFKTDQALCTDLFWLPHCQFAAS